MVKGKRDGTGPRTDCPIKDGSGNPNFPSGGGRFKRGQKNYMPGSGRGLNRKGK